MARRELQVAVTGAHTVVGQKIVRALEDRDFPVATLSLLAPSGTQVEGLPFRGSDVDLVPATAHSFRGVEIAFFVGKADACRPLIASALEAGAYVIDLSPTLRDDPGVPLCVPPIAPLERSDRRLAACPDPLAQALALSLWPLKERGRIRRVGVTSLHSVASRGAAGVHELERQVSGLMNAREMGPEVFPHRVAFNVAPAVGDPDAGAFADERALERQLPRVLGIDGLAVGATCVRVPIFHGNAAAVSVEADRPIDAAAYRARLRTADRIKVVDEPAKNVYPTTMIAVGDESVLVGRIRPDPSRDGGVCLFLAYDYLHTAAFNAVLTAEALVGG